MTEFLQHLVNGLSVGTVYALIALGYTMVFGVLKLINFAHGDVYMVGAYAGYYLGTKLGTGEGSSVAGAALVTLGAMAICGALGYVIERFAYRPLRHRPRLTALITAIGVSFLLEYGFQLSPIIRSPIEFPPGPSPRFFPELLQLGEPLQALGVSVQRIDALGFGVAIALMLALQWIVYRTRFGTAMRAVSFDPTVAGLMGIPVNRVISWTFVLGSALAAAAGIINASSRPRSRSALRPHARAQGVRRRGARRHRLGPRRDGRRPRPRAHGGVRRGLHLLAVPRRHRLHGPHRRPARPAGGALRQGPGGEGVKGLLRSVLPFLLAAPVLAVVQWAMPEAWVLIAISVGVNVVLAVSLNVVNGFTGQFSLGHAGFMAVGAYTAAKITLTLTGVRLPFLPEAFSDQLVFAVALAAGMGTAALAGFLVGMPSLRLRGDYLAIVTLGFGEIIRSIIENMTSLGRATGLSGLPKQTNLVWVGVSALATMVMARRLAVSTQGRALFAIREDETAAEAMGVDTTGYKVRAFTISAAYAGLAGGLIAHAIQLATPRMFTFIRSIEVVVMVVLGGLGSVTGSVVAAAGLTILLEALREFQSYRMVVYALLLVVLMLARPQGLFGTRELWDLPIFRRLGRPRRLAPEPAGAQPTDVRGEGGPGGPA